MDNIWMKIMFKTGEPSDSVRTIRQQNTIKGSESANNIKGNSEKAKREWNVYIDYLLSAYAVHNAQ